MGKSASEKENLAQDDLHRSIRMLESVQAQKQALDDQNEELKRRIEYLETSQIDIGAAALGARNAGVGVPGLNLSHGGDSQDQ